MFVGKEEVEKRDSFDVVQVIFKGGKGPSLQVCIL